MDPDLLYQIALSITPNIGPVQAKILVEQFGTAQNIFKAKIAHLKSIEGIGEIRANSIKRFDRFHEAEEELRFIEKYNILPLFITDVKYPKR
ncbi:MAG TPA: helix-hairpin-helix domain-containing protein, partial [Chitinophagaceae bacterium]